MIPEHRKYFTGLPDDKLLALCIWAEARGEGVEGRIAVGSVVLNRVDYGKKHEPWGRKYGNTVSTVIMAPYQFSWLLSTDPQYKRCLVVAREWDDRDAPGLASCLEIAQGLLSGTIQRNVRGLYYHTLAVKPRWAEKLKVERIIGNHVFYVERPT